MKSFVARYEEEFDEVCEGEGHAGDHAHDMLQAVWDWWSGSIEEQALQRVADLEEQLRDLES